ncbi:MAG: COX15/CtaA family protein [Dehalococcoidia bacterium]
MASVLATIVLIAMGSTVRTNGAGLGCPDWPLCYGGILPPLEILAILEWVHRFIVTIISVLVLTQTAIAWFLRGRDPMLWKLGLLSVLVLFIQALLGGVTVLLGNVPWSVAIHLIAALTLLAVLTVMSACAILGPNRTRIAGAERADFVRAAMWAAASTWIVLLFGAYVVQAGAGPACTTWPLCDGAPIPFLTGSYVSHVHWLHRITVVLGAGVITWLFLYVRGMHGAGRMLQRGAHSLIGLYGLQVLSGALNIFSDFSRIALVLHLALASATWAVMVAVWYAARFDHAAAAHAPRRVPDEARGARA